MRSALCAVCRREPRGFGWFDPVYPVTDPRRDTSRRWLCGHACQDLCQRRRGMIDPTPNEQAAMAAAGAAAGEYLESLDRSDLARLTVEEWQTFIEVVVTGYCDALRELASQDRERLDGVSGRFPL